MIALAPGLPSVSRLLGAWAADPPLLGALAICAGCYLAGAVRAGRRWPARRSLSFVLGLAVLAAALDSGIDGYADLLLSVHMVQHMLLLMVAPVLLAAGAPVRLALLGGGPRVRRALRVLLHHPLVRLLSRPAVGVAALSGMLFATYFTGLFELTLRDQTVHELEHAAYFASGVLCFAPLVAADPLPRPPSAIARFSWLMAVMTAMVIVGVVLTFDPGVRYPAYLAPARALHVSAVDDQQLAGAIMWVGGGIAGAVLTLALVWRAIVAEERRQRRRDWHQDLAAGRVARSAPEVPR